MTQATWSSASSQGEPGRIGRASAAPQDGQIARWEECEVVPRESRVSDIGPSKTAMRSPHLGQGEVSSAIARA